MGSQKCIASREQLICGGQSSQSGLLRDGELKENRAGNALGIHGETVKD